MGILESAKNLFDAMPKRNVAILNAMPERKKNLF